MTLIIQSIGTERHPKQSGHERGRRPTCPGTAGPVCTAPAPGAVVDWQAPGAAAKATMAMSGMEAMQAIRDGILPPPPMANLIGIHDHGRAGPHRDALGTVGEPGERHWPAAWRDRRGAAGYRDGLRDFNHASGGANLGHARPQADYLRPQSVKSGTVQAEGRLVKLGRQTSFTEALVRAGASNLAVHATATFSMVGGAEKVK